MQVHICLRSHHSYISGIILLLFKAVIFNIIVHLNILIQLVFWSPIFFFLPREDGWKIVKGIAWTCLWLQHKIVGSTFDFRGTENIPENAGCIIAAKHQSTWETYTMLLFLADPSYILKRELLFLPFFGWFAWKMDVVGVNRGRKGEALASMTRNSRVQYKEGRQIVIYPEGTRKKPGAEPNYKYGIVHLYKELDATIVPAALNSGLYWPRRSWYLYPGELVLEFLKPIEKGLSKDKFKAKLENVIETATNKIMDESASSKNPPPKHLYEKSA